MTEENAIRASVRSAILEMGVDAFKLTSFFASSSTRKEKLGQRHASLADLAKLK